MTDTPDYYIDIPGLEDSESPGSAQQSQATGRKWIGVHFECCGAYQRIYRNREGTAYHGYCPRCGRPVHVRVGPGGTDARMFRAS